MPLSSCKSPLPSPLSPHQAGEPVRNAKYHAPSATVLNKTRSVSLRSRHSSSNGRPKSAYQNEQKNNGQNAPPPQPGPGESDGQQGRHRPDRVLDHDHGRKGPALTARSER